MSASPVHEWSGTPTHDGPGHRYGDPGYCGGCWWDEVGRHEAPTRRELHAPDCPACSSAEERAPAATARTPLGTRVD